MKNDIHFYMGIDAQIKKGCSYFIINENLQVVSSGWAKERKTMVSKLDGLLPKSRCGTS
jgi:hypothetical protein